MASRRILRFSKGTSFAPQVTFVGQRKLGIDLKYKILCWVGPQIESGYMASRGGSVHGRTGLAYDQIRAQIINLELSPGAPISESSLAQATGFSRTPVRAAIAQLVEDGLVEVFPKVGTFVTRIDPVRVKEAQFLREAVEMASLLSLELPLRTVKFAELRANLQQQRAFLDNPAVFIRLDDEFHQGLMACAGHERSWQVVSSAKGHLDRARLIGLRTIPSQVSLVRQHEQILEALIAGRQDEAESVLRAHLRIVFTDSHDLARRYPEMFALEALADRPRRIGRAGAPPQPR